MNIKAYLVLLLFLLVGCKSIEVPICTNTITREIINNTIPCEETICDCPEQKVITTECKPDNSALIKCNLQNGRLILELDYLKNATANILLNVSFNEVLDNYTQCLKDKNIFLDRLKKINESMGG